MGIEQSLSRDWGRVPVFQLSGLGTRPSWLWVLSLSVRLQRLSQGNRGILGSTVLLHLPCSTAGSPTFDGLESSQPTATWFPEGLPSGLHTQGTISGGELLVEGEGESFRGPFLWPVASPPHRPEDGALPPHTWVCETHGSSGRGIPSCSCPWPKRSTAWEPGSKVSRGSSSLSVLPFWRLGWGDCPSLLKSSFNFFRPWQWWFIYKLYFEKI